MTILLIVFVLILPPLIAWLLLRNFMPAWLTRPVYALFTALTLFVYLVVSTGLSERDMEQEALELNTKLATEPLDENQRFEYETRLQNITGYPMTKDIALMASVGCFIYFLFLWAVLTPFPRKLSKDEQNETD